MRMRSAPLCALVRRGGNGLMKNILPSCRFVGTQNQNGGIPLENERFSTNHYLQIELIEAAEKNHEPMSFAKLMDISFGRNNLLDCARLLQKQLPIRIAKCVVSFHALPFIVASNPSLLRCQELYISAFEQLNNSPPVVDAEGEANFSKSIQDLLDNHKEVISLLSQGFKEAGNHFQDKSLITKFLDNMMKSRLGMRLLCDHYLQLPLDRRGYVGSIETKFSPKYLVERKARETRLQCERKYGSAPEVKIIGHSDATFMYIAPPLDYVLNEILKNAMRAVIESQKSLADQPLPEIVVTVVNNDTNFCFRISDRGGGIKHELVPQVWEYGFSSSHSQECQPTGGVFDLISENRAAGVMFGYGFGLPVCKAFVEHLGGELKMVTMQGHGTDIYMRLPHIEGKEGNFII